MIISRPWILADEARGMEYHGAGGHVSLNSSLREAEETLSLGENSEPTDSIFLSAKDEQISWIEGSLSLSF